MTTFHDFAIKDQPIKSIKILNDRAEVKRLVKVSLKEGVNEVKLTNFANFLEHDSVRVEGRGNATICDVSETKVPALPSTTDCPQVAELKEQLRQITGERQKHEDQRDVLKKKVEVLSKSVGIIGQNVMNPPSGSGTVCIDDNLLEGLQKLFDYHQTQMDSLNEQLREKNRKIEETFEKQSLVKENLKKRTHACHYNISRNVVISLEAREEGEMELDVLYQVIQCGWQPSYDIRVDTEKPSMEISYYGKIHNHSEEDWNNFEAVLSTAQPSLGGHIPELGTLDAYFYRPHVYHSKRRHMPMVQMRSRSAVGPQADEEEDYEEEICEEQINVPQMEVTQNTLSTEFRIIKKTTIQNRTNDHKVIIGTISLTPTLVHQSVPSKNSSAFLIASAVNSSVFPFLEGETTIFLNNAFVAKSQLKSVSPGERFTCSLGVDTGIRVEYKPAKKYHEEAGYITKHSANVTEQTIHVKNTRSEQSVLLTIKHHVPRSTDEKIRVKLISPNAIPLTPSGENEVSEPKEGVVWNKENNLEWTVKLAPNTSKNMLIKWVVEHPKSQTVEYVEHF